MYNIIGGDITDILERLPNCSWNKLQDLYLMETNITGLTLKPLLNLTNLSMLDIFDNYLSGSVPVNIGTLKQLTELYIDSNSLSGVMSEDHFSGLTNLKYIDLSDTHIQVKLVWDWKPPFNLDMAYFSSCHLGPQVPNWLRWQKNILYLGISDTGLVGTMPHWFWNTFSNATLLDLPYNSISGELPHNLEFMAVTELYLQSNNLSGLLPQLPRSIVLLYISKNSLNGHLPSDFGAPYLQIVILFCNCITGIIPNSICQCPQLRVLDLSNNMLTGGLPNCSAKELRQRNPSSNSSSRARTKNSYGLQIHTLLLNNTNGLSDQFPLCLKQCQNLMFLGLTLNRFSGKLPMWISEAMPILVMLRVRNNNFYGHIPVETTKLYSLRILDLANNKFSGGIPQPLVNLKALTTTVVASTENPFQEV
jgi:Leucine-rich repeat (LRR) protein